MKLFPQSPATLVLLVLAAAAATVLAGQDGAPEAKAEAKAGNVSIFGAMKDNAGNDMCGLVLANGQFMFTCSPDGPFSLSVPLDANNQITLFGFADSHYPYKKVLGASGGRADIVLQSTDNSISTSTVNFTLSDGCIDGIAIDYRIFDVTHGLAWPSATTLYTLATENTPYTQTIQCQTGSQMCYGARNESGNLNWGRNTDNSYNCSTCCVTCGPSALFETQLICPKSTPSRAAPSDTSPQTAPSHNFIAGASPKAKTYVNIAGTVTDLSGQPLCGLVIANGQFQFTCNPDGPFALAVPLDAHNQVTVFAFVDGFLPVKITLGSGGRVDFVMRRSVNPTIAFQVEPLPDSMPGQAYDAELVNLAAVTGGASPYHCQADTFANGTPPLGLSITPGCHLSGTVSANAPAGAYTFNVCVFDVGGNSKCLPAAIALTQMPRTNCIGTYSLPINNLVCFPGWPPLSFVASGDLSISGVDLTLRQGPFTGEVTLVLPQIIVGNSSCYVQGTVPEADVINGSISSTAGTGDFAVYAGQLPIHASFTVDPVSGVTGVLNTQYGTGSFKCSPQ